MKAPLFRESLFILLTFLLLLAIIIAALHLPFSASSGAQTQARTPTLTNALQTPTPTVTQTLAPISALLNVSGTQWGLSTCYIGAVEGSSNFNRADLQDLGINVYHIYGSMSRWEGKDDSTTYGTPTIEQIKANPMVINWAAWDNAMTNPPGGSDYWWVNASPAWQGNARTLFSTLQATHIRPILDLRNRDDQNQPLWAPDPPTTTADWNEWWEHVFALVYWLDVRNHYAVNDFEIQNEPDLYAQGWHGTLEQYELFVQYTNDAISFVYHKYLPGQTYHLYGPATSGYSSWPNALMQQHLIDSVDVHDYDTSITQYVEQVHSWMNANGYESAPLWLSEWGSYHPHSYDSPSYGIRVLNNLIDGSSPGNDYVYGSTIFALYDYATNAVGFINATGERRLDYYALRMGIRALQGCRPTYQSTANNNDVAALTTLNANGSYSLLVTNRSQQQPYTLAANLSALVNSGSGTLQRFDAQDQDRVDGTVQIVNGRAIVTIPSEGAILLTFSK